MGSRRRRRPAPWYVGALVLLVLLSSALLTSRLAGQQKASPTPDSTPHQEAVTPQAVAVHKVANTDLTRTLLVTGELKAARSRDIAVPNIRSGFASAVTYLALEGSAVKQGERILEFDAASLLERKSEAERQMDEAKLTIAKTKADLEATRADLMTELATAEGNLKVARLYAKIEKGLLPANTFQKYQLDLDKAQLALNKAKEKLANHDASVPAQVALAEVTRSQAELELKKTDSDLEKMSIDAPQDGIVVYGDNWASNRKVQVGDTLFPGMPVLSLPDMSSMQVVGYVYDTELRFLSAGMICDIHLDAVPGRHWAGRIESLTSVANRKGFASQHKVFRAVVQPGNIDLAVMKPGMTARLEFTVSLGSGVLAIPRDCLGLDTAGKYYVLKGRDRKTASTQAVKVGRFSDHMVEILDGLKSGDDILALHRATQEVKS